MYTVYTDYHSDGHVHLLHIVYVQMPVLTTAVKLLCTLTTTFTCLRVYIYTDTGPDVLHTALTTTVTTTLICLRVYIYPDTGPDILLSLIHI